MTITLTQKELLALINDYFKSEPKVDRVSVSVEVKKGLEDIISFKEDSWFVGSFIREKIKNKEKE